MHTFLCFSGTLPYAGSEDVYFAGGTAGIQLGYNQVMSNGTVLGVETDANWANIYDLNRAYNKSDSSAAYILSYSGSPPVFTRYLGSVTTTNSYNQTTLNALGSARFRIGYVFDKFMPYLTGGVSYGLFSKEERNYSASIPGFIPYYAYGIPSGVSSNQTYSNKVKAGWAVGTGFEYMLAQNWSTKLEYMYSSIGPVSFIENGGYSSFGVHQARFGLNYHMNWLEIR